MDRKTTKILLAPIRVIQPRRTSVYSLYKLGKHWSIAVVSQMAPGAMQQSRLGYIVIDLTLVEIESLADLTIKCTTSLVAYLLSR